MVVSKRYLMDITGGMESKTYDIDIDEQPLKTFKTHHYKKSVQVWH